MILAYNRSVKQRNLRSSRFGPNAATPGRFPGALNSIPTGCVMLGLAKHNASTNDFRAAYELTQQYGEPVALPRVASNMSLQDLENRFAAAPNRSGIGYELYRAQMQNGRVDEALLTARHFTERQNSPPYFHFLEAQCWAEKQN